MQRTKKEHRVFVHTRVGRSLKGFGILDLVGGKVSGVWINWSEYETPAKGFGVLDLIRGKVSGVWINWSE